MNDFNRQALDDLKGRVDLVQLIRDHGLELKKVGQNLAACCPWHEDNEASLIVNPAKQLFNCFGCEAKGDVLSFLQLRENLTFPKALERLKELAGNGAAPADPDRFEGGLTRPQLLTQVANFYSKALLENEEALEFLRERGLAQPELLDVFKLGFCNGTLLTTLPRKGEVREALHEMGLLNNKGREHFLGCVVVPLEHPDQGLVGFYGRRISPRAKVRHLFLPGPKRGVLNWPTLRSAEEVYLVEGVLDALSLWASGVHNVTCLHGLQLPQDVGRFLRGSTVRDLRVCLDADRAGEEAFEGLVEGLADRFRLGRVLLPDGTDPNDILRNNGPEVLRSFLSCVQPLETEEETDRETPLVEELEQGFRLTFEKAEYEITPRPPYTGRLQVALRAKTRGQARPKKFLDRCDLTSARARAATLRGLSQKLGLPKEVAESHLSTVLDTTENWVDSLNDTTDSRAEAPTLTETQKAEALEFLQQPNLVKLILADMEELGYVGEERGKLLAYLIGISRKLENPLSGIIRSQSGAGKSGLAGLVGQLTPPEDVIHYSRVSAHALAYAGQDFFKRKLLIMEERAGGEAADYYIRVLQSSHKIRQAVVVKDPASGKMKTEEFEVEGPIAYLETTTESHLNHENTTRCFELYLDETEAQTQRIHQRQRQARSLERLKRADKQKILERHHNAQRMLEPVKVVIPYVDLLNFPSRWLRTRRDHERFLCLIEASAFLHQHQRTRKTVTGPDGEEVPYIEANLEDYRLAYELAKDVLRDTLHELSIPARELLEAAKSLPDNFTRRQLREKVRWPQRRVHDTLAELVEMEYLLVTAGSNGSAFRYVVALENQKQDSPIQSLTHPDELAKRLGGQPPP